MSLVDRAFKKARRTIAPKPIILSPEQQLWNALEKIESETVERGSNRSANQINGLKINKQIQSIIRTFLKDATLIDGTTSKMVEDLPIQTVELHTIPSGTEEQDWHYDVPEGTGPYYTGIIPVTNHWGTMFSLTQGTSQSGWVVQTKQPTLHSGTTVHCGPSNKTLEVRRMIAVVFSNASDPNSVPN